MTRAELRDLVRTAWDASPKSWVMAGLAFARLAPHILEELDRAAEAERLASGPAVDAEADTPVPEGRRVG